VIVGAAANHGYLRGIYLRLAGVIMLAVMAALAFNAFLSHRSFERSLAPEVARKVTAGGDSIRALVLKAVAHGVAFDELYGVEQKFDEVRSEMPEIASFALTDTTGAVRYQRLTTPPGAPEHFRSAEVLAALHANAPGPAAPRRIGNQVLVSLPVVAPEGPLGMLHIGVDVRFVDELLLEMTFDVLVVLVVSLFFTLELLHFMAGARLDAALRSLAETFSRGAEGRFATAPGRLPAPAFGSVIRLLESALERVNAGYAALACEVDAARRMPLNERPPGLEAAQSRLAALGERYRFGSTDAVGDAGQRQLAKIRAPLFVFILAEELTRPFLPAYAQELAVPIAVLPTQVVVGLPIALFMLIVALAQPGLGALCERVGQRRLMHWGAWVAGLGFVASAFAASVLDLLLWRSLCAAGYAAVFVAAQAYVLEHADAGSRAKGFALFVGAIMVATVCGPSIGGILADNIGVRPTFGVAAALALASLAAIRQLPDRGARAAPSPRRPGARDVLSLLANPRFLAVTAFAAVPAKILLTGACFYLVPLYVLTLSGTQAMAGRILMTYAVVMVVVSPLAAGWALRRERMEWLVGGGLVLSGLGGVLLLGGGGLVWVFLSVGVVGIGQAMSISAQSALVSEVCAVEVARIGEGPAFGVYRLLERLGNALGPIAAALLAVWLGERSAFVALGAFVAACGLAFVLATRIGAVRSGAAAAST